MFPFKSTIRIVADAIRLSCVFLLLLPWFFSILVVLFFFGGVPFGTATLFLPLVECNNTERWRRRRHPIISRVNPPVHKTLENVYTYRIVSAAAATTASAAVYQQLWQRAVSCEEIYIRRQFRLFGFYACMHLSQCKNIKAVTALETPTDAQGQCYTFMYVYVGYIGAEQWQTPVCVYTAHHFLFWAFLRALLYRW